MRASSSVPPTIVKLGGSIVTRKREPFRLRPKVLQRLGRELAEGWTEGKHPLVVLHGAGSFGHPTAKAWGLARPPPGRANRPRGAALTALGVRQLHLEVLRSLLDAGLPARSVPPYPFARNRAGKLERFSSEPFADAVRAGDVPVSFGDVVDDLDWGSSILSADTIAIRLVADLHAPRAIFVSDVAGVLVGAPGPARHVLPRLEKEVPSDLAPDPRRPDVTGGIRGKAEAMLAIGALGARAGLISGLSHGLLSRALRGEETYGTWT